MMFHDMPDPISFRPGKFHYSRAWIAALTYLALGALGISFAVAPSYASPIFPAAGFAVAYLLWAGHRKWPAIWAGSLALNVGIALIHGNVSARTVAVAVGIATASALQALLARALLVRVCADSWRTLEEQGSIMRCLTLAGPIACLVSSSLAVSVLWWAQMVPGGDYANAWWNWWSGDVLGVLIMMPLSLAMLQRHDVFWKGRLSTLLPPMLVTLSVVAGVFVVAMKFEKGEDAQTVSRYGETLSKLLTQRFIAHQEALAALHRLYEVTPEMDQSRFSHFTNITLTDNPDIFALSINPFVQEAKRPLFEAEMGLRARAPEFEIRERDPQGALVRAHKRASYVPVGLIAPLEGNSAAVGFDINSDPLRRDAIERAMQTGAPVVTSPLQLVQENQQRVGVLLMHPAHSSTVLRHTGSAALMGFAVGVIKVDQMVDIAIRGSTIPGLVFRIEDARAAAGQSMLYDSNPAAQLPLGESLWRQDVPMADRTWRLSVFPTPEFLGSRSHWTVMLVGAGGLLLASLLQVLLLVATGSTALVRRKVREQTAQLEFASAAMSDQNAQLNVLFTLSPDGLVAISADGRVGFANPAFLEMTGIAKESVVGKSESVLNALIKERCAAPQAFAGIETCFNEGATPLRRVSLELKIPAPKVVQMVGVHSNAPGIARILYLRDVTHETEVENIKSEFLSTAAHELRTPMASIFGFAEVLLTQEVDDRTRKEMLDIIYRQSALMASILNELLDLARIEARRGKDFVLELIDLPALIDKVVHEFKPPDARQAPVLGSHDGNFFIVGDDKKARQAVLNLLSNAYKYSPDGGLVEIDLLARKPEGASAQVGIRIVDHGIGMTPEQQARVFERFYRADTSGKIPGTGLGMSIVHEIVELHGGTVEISSHPGTGTTVTMWLPAAQSPPTTPSQQAH